MKNSYHDASNECHNTSTVRGNIAKVISTSVPDMLLIKFLLRRLECNTNTVVLTSVSFHGCACMSSAWFLFYECHTEEGVSCSRLWLAITHVKKVSESCIIVYGNVDWINTNFDTKNRNRSIRIKYPINQSKNVSIRLFKCDKKMDIDVGYKCDIVWRDLVAKGIKHSDFQTKVQVVACDNVQPISNDQIRFPKCILLNFPKL